MSDSSQEEVTERSSLMNHRAGVMENNGFTVNSDADRNARIQEPVSDVPDTRQVIHNFYILPYTVLQYVDKRFDTSLKPLEFFCLPVLVNKSSELILVEFDYFLPFS